MPTLRFLPAPPFLDSKSPLALLELIRGRGE